MSRRISQRQAREWRKRALAAEAVLLDQRRGWAAEWPGGEYLCSVTLSDTCHVPAQVKTARRLGHAVVVVVDGQRLSFVGLPIGGQR